MSTASSTWCSGTKTLYSWYYFLFVHKFGKLHLHHLNVFLVFVVARSEIGFIIFDNIEISCLWILPSNYLNLFLCFESGWRAIKTHKIIILTNAVYKLILLFKIILEEHFRLKVENFTWDGIVLGGWCWEEGLFLKRTHRSNIALLGTVSNLLRGSFWTLSIIHIFRVEVFQEFWIHGFEGAAGNNLGFDGLGIFLGQLQFTHQKSRFHLRALLHLKVIDWQIWIQLIFFGCSMCESPESTLIWGELSWFDRKRFLISLARTIVMPRSWRLYTHLLLSFCPLNFFDCKSNRVFNIVSDLVDAILFGFCDWLTCASFDYLC